MGCVLPAGLGQAPARQAALGAGLCQHVEAHHGQQDVRLGHAGRDDGRMTPWPPARADVIVAGGMESMTNAPYLMTKHRGGARIGHDVMFDHMFLDGLEDAYEPGRLMGSFAEDTARDLPVHARGPGRLRDRER